ncbi:MAG: hypothetical protein A3K46_02740 [Chloroflexi bacterium RBG_13_60_9]|nr:MAG: hypothetical protein A3K46_02740 [Chloroflexi bacterium RBG_13_60_9]
MMEYGKSDDVIEWLDGKGVFPPRLEEIRKPEGRGEGIGFRAGDFEQSGAEIEARVSAVKTAVGEVLRCVAVPAAEIGHRGLRRNAVQQTLRAGLDTRAGGGEGPGEGLIEFPIEVNEAAGNG